MSAAATALITGALILGFYAAFTADRLAFWAWLAALVVLLPADNAIRRSTRLRGVPSMTEFYGSYGVKHPQLRARIAVVFARLSIPLFIAAAINVDARVAIDSLCIAHPVVPIAALAAGAILGPWYIYRDTLHVSGATG